jgi:hypothetical protein
MPIFIVEEVGRSLVGVDEWLPTVSIDVSGFPAIADLARVHAVEGIGDVNTFALRQDDSLVLGVRITIPVTASFAVVFNRTTHREFLQDVANAGSLIFASTNTDEAHTERPLWLSVDIDGESLRKSIE